MQESTEVCAR